MQHLGRPTAAAAGAPPWWTLLGVPRPGGVRDHIRSGALTPRMLQTVGDDLARGAAHSAEARGMQIVGRFVALRQHAAGVVEPVVVAGQVFEVAGDAVRFAQRGSGFQRRAGTRRCCGSACPPARASSSSRCRCSARDAQLGGVARQRRQPGVRVLHVVDRVFVGCRRPQRQVDVDRDVAPRTRISEYRAASTPMASTRSSSVMTVPARLLIRTGWPSRTRLTICPISTSTVAGSSPSEAAMALSRAM